MHLEKLIAAFRNLGHSVRLVGPRAFERSAFGSEPAALQATRATLPPALYEFMEICYNSIAVPRLLAGAMRFRPDFIYERYNLYSLAGVCVSKLTGIPLLLEINAPLAAERCRYGGLAFPKLARRLENWTWRNATAALPVTAVLAGHLRRGGVSDPRIHIVPNGIDLLQFSGAPAAERSKDALGLAGKVVIGFAGFARPWHGLDRIIGLLARPEAPPELHALIVGEGPVLAELKAQASELGVSQKVTFAGLVEHSRIAARLAAVDIALLPGCVDYCSPLKLFEYMALGKAIVAPDQPNIREVLEHGSSALLFPPQDPQAMAGAVLRLAQDAELRNRLGGAAKSLIAARGFTWQNNARRVIDLGSRAAGGIETFAR